MKEESKNFIAYLLGSSHTHKKSGVNFFWPEAVREISRKKKKTASNNSSDCFRFSRSTALLSHSKAVLPKLTLERVTKESE